MYIYYACNILSTHFKNGKNKICVRFRHNADFKNIDL